MGIPGGFMTEEDKKKYNIYGDRVLKEEEVLPKKIKTLKKESIKIVNKKENFCNEYKRTKEEDSQMGKKTAARFSKGKIRHDLIPNWVLDEIAKVYTYGCSKYSEKNYLKGLKWSGDVIGPLKRHLNKWLRGEKIDEESNCHHLALVIWQCMTLMIYEKYKLGNDDRNPYDMDMLPDGEQEKLIELWLDMVKNGNETEFDGLNI